MLYIMTTKKTLSLINFLNIDEIYSILNSLGYVDNEIKDSIKIITTNEKENSLLLNSLTAEEKAEQMDKHLKEILMKLSEKST